MTSFVLGFQQVDGAMAAKVGGKAANLGELAKIGGIRVPDGFCVTTEAYAAIVGRISAFDSLLEQLSHVTLKDTDSVRTLSKKLRDAIEKAPIPQEIGDAVVRQLTALGENDAYAVRSSATAEDLPGASFAGQQDTYLNVIGTEEILTHVSKCWASLFTERAVLYRMQNNFGHRKVALAVVIQKMVFPQAAGILFTADPVTGNRKVTSIDAGFGLGEALVSGIVNADTYTVRDGGILTEKISAKNLAIHAVRGGGTTRHQIAPAQQKTRVLTEQQILELERLGRKIEAHFGRPQDIEWCLADGAFFFVQSRPITTLFPIPDAGDAENHVYVSTGHQQMMTDAMKPLGLSFFLLTTRAPMRAAGGRLFVDIARQLSTAAGRNMLVNVLGASDPLMKDIFQNVIGREFVALAPDTPAAPKGAAAPPPAPPAEPNRAMAAELILGNQASIEALRRKMQTLSGPAVFDGIREDIPEMQKILFDPKSSAVFMGAMNAASWINDHVKEWLGEKNASDVLTQSVPDNITSEMGMALLDLADVIRPHRKVTEYLRNTNDDGFVDGLGAFDGGKQAADAIRAFLKTYGMRCAGEIDITRPRWSERPATLLPLVLSNVKNFAPGESKRRFERGLREAAQKERELLERLKALPDGEQKAAETKRKIDVLRDCIGYREYPKYGMVSRYFIYKQALLKEALRLVEAGILRQAEDMYFLTFQELQDVVRTRTLEYGIIAKRKEDFALFEKLTPPRVMTSEGEIIAGKYNRDDLPAGALAGLAVSSGLVEGRARVLLSMEDAALEEGDILVTAFTDPSWTPLFLGIKGLVTEVGGLMTHGAVIAREYGLPAVVGVENATGLIKDGQRIRVHGTEGYVELL